MVSNGREKFGHNLVPTVIVGFDYMGYGYCHGNELSSTVEDNEVDCATRCNANALCANFYFARVNGDCGIKKENCYNATHLTTDRTRVTYSRSKTTLLLVWTAFSDALV